MPLSATPTLSHLLDFQGPPGAFWKDWTRTALARLHGDLAVLYVRPAGGNGGGDGGLFTGWSVLTAAPHTAEERRDRLPTLTATVGEELMQEALAGRAASGPARQGNWTVCLIAVRPEAGEHELMLCVHVPNGVQTGRAQQWLGLLALVPRCYELGRDRRRVQRDSARFSEMLEVLWRILEAEGFDQAALAFANELCTRFGCEQVSLMWTSRTGLTLRAVSHSEKLERRTELTELLEEAGQEAVSQSREIAWPDGGKAVTRAHRAYADASRPGHLLTLPLVLGDTSLGAVVCERRAAKFSQSEQWALRVLCDQAARPLRDLELQQRPLYRRMPREIARSVPKRLTCATPEGKLLAWGLAAALVGALFIPLPYRIDAGVTIKTDRMAFVGAPFDGYIESSSVTLGDAVREGDPLFRLATQELMLERVANLADLAQYSREAEKRMAAGQLVEMRIAEAQVAQTQAKLDQAEYRLAHAQASAPIAGIVVDGEPGKNIGGAVKRGETVVKIAAVDDLFAEIMIDERDVHLVAPGQTASVALIANPNGNWAMEVKRVIPSATVKDGTNMFPARAEPTGGYPDWWRPGMSGVAKVDVGRRSLFWIATHRLIDYIRITFWV
ncbi:efflux RND transporter periplasmic adaptor subunit [Azospirillum sp. sgz302134]